MGFGKGMGPQNGRHRVFVNRGDLNAGELADFLNDQDEDGYEFLDVFEQAGNTIVILRSRS